MKGRVAILGAGISGIGAAILAKNKGYDVWVSDTNKIKEPHKKVLKNIEVAFEENKHSENVILSSDIVIVSPGIPLTAPIIGKIKESQIQLISEIEFASWFAEGKIIAITGSNGKTTTATLLHHILINRNIDAELCGNVGNSFAKSVAEGQHDYWVVEVSSFQLDTIEKFKPYIAILTNITPDHLDRYDGKFDNYVRSKFKIAQNQDCNDYLIYCNEDDATTNNISKMQIKSNLLSFGIQRFEGSNAYVQDNKINIEINNTKFDMKIEELALQGSHNVYNTMAASIASKMINVRNESLKTALATFENIPHRLEFVAKVSGVTYINDSKATNVNSSWYALETMPNDGVIWIVGGVDKGNDYHKLKTLVDKKVKSIIALGVDNDRIIEEFSPLVKSIYSTSSMEQAVLTAYQIATKGNTVLLSPACASFDLFENFEQRGDMFKKIVRAL
ncbi:MAG: UDP-N-acetylmuramoyl-L-alanine--D-glutamate ligase [Lentimicrobiaceae bacterium]|nr:UDP-N-acetylmuramoyl-L-alanine--D-glutamate ligase [Lentimicrobiaceae bacterium]